MISEGIINIIGSPEILFTIALGVFIGIVFGCIPGLSGQMAIVMCLSLSFSMDITMATALLFSLFIGGVSGGLISAILINIPGTTSAVATCWDGYPMAKAGNAGKALGAGIVFSFMGTLFGAVCMIAFAEPLSNLAIKFGPYEYTALIVLAMSLVIVLAGRHPMRGLLGALIGLLLATIGQAPLDGVPRYTFGVVNLNSGISMLSVLIGLYAIGELLVAAEQTYRPDPTRSVHAESAKIKGFGITRAEWLKALPTFFQSSIIGTFLGFLPGLGGNAAGVTAYAITKSASKDPDSFGKGNLLGVVAPESANNATIGGATLPMLTLGIPGDATTAVLMGALAFHGVHVGPMIFHTQGALVYSIMTVIIIASFVQFLIQFGAMRLFVKLLKIPKNFMFPIILVFCVVGVYANSRNIMDVIAMAGFGLLGYGMEKVDVPKHPFAMAFILGSSFETNIRKLSQYLAVKPFNLLEHPVALVILIIMVIVIGYTFRKNHKLNAAEAAAGGSSQKED